MKKPRRNASSNKVSNNDQNKLKRIFPVIVKNIAKFSSVKIEFEIKNSEQPNNKKDGTNYNIFTRKINCSTNRNANSSKNGIDQRL